MQNIRDKFISAFEKDKDKIKNWLVSWDYQKQLKKRKYAYDNLLNDFFLLFQERKIYPSG